MRTLKKQSVYIVSKDRAWRNLIVASLSAAFQCRGFVEENSVENLWNLHHSDIVVFDKLTLKNPTSLCVYPIERGGKWLIVNAGDVDEQNVVGIIALGFSGLITTPFTFEMLPRALRTITTGQLWFSRDAMSQTLRTLITQAGSLHNSADILGAKYALTNRESQVLNHLLQGESNKEIAAQLYLSPSTVKCHVSSILLKTGKHSRCEIGMLLMKEKEDSALAASSTV